MVKQEGGGGFQSAAGLMRYFDEEDEKSPKIDPRLVIALIIVMIVVLEVARWQWPV
ncbi:MAG: preprotein translocase subunit Sec61beta [Candidatus Thermoplasmatota archaeon]|nr:preprotein translocase subunit Sec61beta [Candidatus Thermoplasmatota archaeon]MBS3790923.1 preprotein translocase subunit Sec61beta [Candidatus Thermoplasmatota archaeon]